MTIEAHGKMADVKEAHAGWKFLGIWAKVHFVPILFSEGLIMSVTIEAIYESGVLKPAKPLPLKEHEKVQVTIHSEISPILQAYGIMGWEGDAETFRRLTQDCEFDSLT